MHLSNTHKTLLCLGLLLVMGGGWTAMAQGVPGLDEIHNRLSASTGTMEQIVRKLGYILFGLGLVGLGFKMAKKTNDAIDTLTYWLCGIGVFLIALTLMQSLLTA